MSADDEEDVKPSQEMYDALIELGDLKPSVDDLYILDKHNRIIIQVREPGVRDLLIRIMELAEILIDTVGDLEEIVKYRDKVIEELKNKQDHDPLIDPSQVAWDRSLLRWINFNPSQPQQFTINDQNANTSIPPATVQDIKKAMETIQKAERNKQ